MDLLERYLKSVKFFLPRDQRDDIAAELSEDIRSQIEDREAQLGRTLNEAELKAVLARCGSPLAVAERFLPQQHLIGPGMFPLYGFALKLIAWVYLLPWLAVWFGWMIVDPAFRARHGVLNDAWAFCVMALTLFAITTLIFALIERRQVSAGGVAASAPRAAAGQTNRIPLSESILDLILSTVFAIWWLDVGTMTTLGSPGSEGEYIALAPIWRTLYWPIFFLLASGMVLSVVSLMWRKRTMVHTGLALARALFSLVLVCISMSPGRWVEIVAPGYPPEHIAKVSRWLNLPIFVTLAIIGISCVVAICRDTRRLLRARTLRAATAAPGLALLLAITTTAGTVAAAAAGSALGARVSVT